MSDDNDNASKVLGLAGQLVSLAKESKEMGQVGQNFAKSTLTISKAIDNCLLPIAAMNYGFERARIYFQEKFPGDVAEATSGIPEKNLVEPKPSIAAPIIEGLTFSHEEPDLKKMYLSLLASAMDGKRATAAHPSFASIIKQMSSEEARYLKDILKSTVSLPIIRIERKVLEGGGVIVLDTNIMNTTNSQTGEPYWDRQFPSYVSNWDRLGLIEIDYVRHRSQEGSYDWAEKRPEYETASLEVIDGTEVSFAKGIISITPFGRGFAEAVLN